MSDMNEMNTPAGEGMEEGAEKPMPMPGEEGQEEGDEEVAAPAEGGEEAA